MSVVRGRSGHRGELTGFRRWVRYITRDRGLSETLDEGETLHTEEGGHGNLAQSLALVRSVADKFLILCLLDREIRPLYAPATGDLPLLKQNLVEALLAAFRDGEDNLTTPLSLDTYRKLSEAHTGALRKHLEAAIKEFSNQSKEVDDVESLTRKLCSAPGVPFTLLPRQAETEVEQQAVAIKAKGGDAATRVLKGLEFAPLHVPLKRRRQMFACVLAVSLIPGGISIFLISGYFWRITWPVLIPYLSWALYFDKSPWTGGMKIVPWMRRMWVWRNWAEYFPAGLIKSNPDADFSGKRPILMGYHPHGILSFGAQINFGTEATGWSKKFPNITPRICTLNMNLKMPILREAIGRLGAIPAAKEAIVAALKPGNAVIVVVGGAAESLDTKPGEYILTLARRTGFFKLALQHGADLVPTFGFGENDLFDTHVPNSTIRQLQQKFLKVMTFGTPFFYGRGVFTYNAGILPYRRPLNVVVGDPIPVEKVAEPSKEQIEAVKTQYIAALRELHAKWAPRLEPGRDAPLIIL